MMFDQRILVLYLIFCIRSLKCQMTTSIQYEFFSSRSNYSRIERGNRTDGRIPSLSKLSDVPRAPAFVLLDAFGKYDACQPAINPPNFTNGIALIQRGGDCTFNAKISRAKQYNASAVLIYDPQGQSGVNMKQNQSDILSSFISPGLGAALFDLVLDPRSRLNISIGLVRSTGEEPNSNGSWYGSRSATIFIAVSVSVLVSVCLLWFLFYYCQRYRARTAKNRLQARLNNAAKKALAKITLMTVTDPSRFDEPCVICLDNIKTGDVIRQLVCHHTFHQTCVDPWLLTHRHCPLCNLDILAAYHITLPNRIRQCSVAPETNPDAMMMADRSSSSYPRLPTISATIADDGQRIHALHSEQTRSDDVSPSV